MKRRRKTLILAILFALCTLMAVPVQASEIKRLPGGTNFIEGWPAGPKAASSAAVVLEADTGIVVYNKRMTEKRYPASITKILTALLVLENCSLTEQVTFDETGLQEIYSNNSNIGMMNGEVLTVEQCLYAILLESANEVATQLAKHAGGGDVQTFVDQMNERARQIGCTGTHFTNASGLPDENHYTTAYDLALIMQECLKNEKFLEICGTYQYELPPTNTDPNPQLLTNHHPLIQPGQYHYEETIAGKTGYTDMSQNTLITAASWEGSTYIAVTLGSDIGGVINDTTNLLNYGFLSFEKIPAEREELIIGDGTLLVPKGTKREELTFEAAAENGGVRRTYCFGENTYVGTALLTLTEETKLSTPTPVPEETSAALSQEDMPKTQTSLIPYVIIGVLSLAILIGLLVILLRLISRRK